MAMAPNSRSARRALRRLRASPKPLALRCGVQTLIIALMALGLAAIPAHAQIASYVNDHGNLVYINSNIPVTRAAASAKAAPPASAASSSNASAAAAAALGTPLQAPPVPGSTAPQAIPPQALDQLVQQTAEKHNVDPQLVRAVIATESNWDTAAVSPKGAMGLMQLIPGTAEELGVRNAFDPQQNVDAGVRYLGMLLERYNFDFKKALAAYNAGPSVVDRVGGVPNYPETRHYVEKVTSNYLQTAPGGRPGAWGASHPIYRTTDAEGHVVFTNE